MKMCSTLHLSFLSEYRSKFLLPYKQKDLEKEDAATIRAKVSLTLQNSKPSKDKLSKDERKALKKLQSDTSIVVLPADKGRSTVIHHREDYCEKCMNHINNGPYQLLKKEPATNN